MKSKKKFSSRYHIQVLDGEFLGLENTKRCFLQNEKKLSCITFRLLDGRFLESEYTKLNRTLFTKLKIKFHVGITLRFLDGRF